MKITHNKVGQNLNLVDGTKTEKTKSGVLPSSSDKSVDQSKGSELGGSTKVEVSSKAQEAKRIKELALAAPDVDEAKVAKFRQMIDEGKYKVDSKAIADKMVDEHLAMEDLKN